MHTRKLKLAVLLFSSLVLALSPTAFADTLYNNQAAFLNALGTHITDDYTNPGYHPQGNFNVLSNAAMNAVLGQTQYQSLTFPDQNYVFSQPNGAWFYCTGCNGSFSLNFGATSVTNGLGGVYGVGITTAYSLNAYEQITFTDGASILVQIPDANVSSSFFGITDSRGISSIRFVNADGTNSNGGDGFVFTTKGLTIGDQRPEAVPEPGSMVLLGSGLLGMAGAVRRKLVA